MNRMTLSLVVVMAAALGAAPAVAQEAGHVKVAKGSVQIERGGQKIPATLGAMVQAGDVVVTGADGSVGITFLDNSLLSAGPNSVLAIDRFAFDSTTHQGSFESSLQEGHARRRVRQARQAVAGRHEGEDARRGAGRARHRVPRSHRRPEELTRGSAMASRAALLALAVLLLVGCAKPMRDDLYVLMPDQDGKTGALSVESGGQQAVLDQPYASARVTEPGRVTAGAINRAGGPQGLRRRAGRAAAAADLLRPLLPRGPGRADPGLPAAPRPHRGRDRPAARAGDRGHRPHRPGRRGALQRHALAPARRAGARRAGEGRHRGRPHPGGGARGARAAACPPRTRWPEPRNRRVEINVR